MAVAIMWSGPRAGVGAEEVALAAREPRQRRQHLEAAFSIYHDAYLGAAERGAVGEAYYTGINAATLALLNAIEKSGSTEIDVLTKALQSEWVATPLGIIKFDEKGDAIGVGFAMYQVQNGQYVTVEF